MRHSKLARHDFNHASIATQTRRTCRASRSAMAKLPNYDRSVTRPGPVTIITFKN